MRDMEDEFVTALNKDLAKAVYDYIDYLRSLPKDEYERMKDAVRAWIRENHLKVDADENGEKLRKESIEALIRTGVLNPDGTQKETIVTVEEEE